MSNINFEFRKGIFFIRFIVIDFILFTFTLFQILIIHFYYFLYVINYRIIFYNVK